MNRKDLNQRLYQHLSIDVADRAAYEELAAFHYRDATLGPVTDIFAIIDRHPRRRPTVPAAGVIVYRPPVPNLAIRNSVTGGYFSGLDRASGLSLLNRHVRCISRVIIDPRYRGLGLARWLVAETMPLTAAGMVEASSVMGRFHPFFQQAGMSEYTPTPDIKTERMAAALETVGIDENAWIDTGQVHEQIEALDKPQRQFIDQQIERFLQKFASQRDMAHSRQRTDFLLSKLAPPGQYYAWLNPEKPVPGLNLAVEQASVSPPG